MMDRRAGRAPCRAVDNGGAPAIIMTRTEMSPDPRTERDPPARQFTPEATIGPFYPGAFVASAPQDLWNVAPLIAHRPQGESIVFVARFLDSLARPVPSLIVEFWQSNAHGRYRHPADVSDVPLDPQFDGYARLRTSDDGVLEFHTIKPGAHAVPGQIGVVRAPHLRLTIFASGIDRLYTEVFFAGEPLNGADPLLQSLPDAAMRDRLIARPREAPYAGAGAYELTIVLRGEGETPFFDDW
jgi:protocatechuate 3,4-dioxygenase alpha subunit